METKMFTKPLVTALATHPGTLLRDELEYRAIDKHELASWMNIEPVELAVVLDGEKPITPDTAMKLEKMLGIDAYYWLRTQAKYDIDVLRIREWKNNPDVFNEMLAGSIAIANEPKSAYANLGRKITA
jgi:addiction module HigA family antidote